MHYLRPLLLLSLSLSLSLSPCVARTVADPQAQIVGQIARFERAFVARDLARLAPPPGRPLRVTLIHALQEPPDGVEHKRFASFAAFEAWLRSREYGPSATGGVFPMRAATARTITPTRTQGQPAVLVKYDNQGISHNTLYLKRLHLRPKGAHHAIHAVVLYDGD